MKKIQVEVQKDFLESVTRTSKPIKSIHELIWNGFDADAKKVSVYLKYNTLKALEEIIVEDNGDGFSYKQAEDVFRNLGNSWKKHKDKTSNGRAYHGKAGKGRFKAFALGGSVRWISKYAENGSILCHEITGTKESLGSFDIDGPRKANSPETGTTVTVYDCYKDYTPHFDENAIQELTQEFALYLLKYPELVLDYNGTRINPSELVQNKEERELDVEFEDDIYPAIITIIEWEKPNDRKIILCDEEGFALGEVSAGIHAPGFYFTAFVKCGKFREMIDNNTFDMDNMPFKEKVIELSKASLKDHFRRRTAERARSIVEKWKDEKVYPYTGEPNSIIETSERQVFDIVAMNYSEYSPSFNDNDYKNKKVILSLLKHSLETSPSMVRKLLTNILDLPKEKQEEFADLLEKTSLDAIISASHLVADRLEFIEALKYILFDKDMKKHILERQHLHRILAKESWIFGEEYALICDDENLRTVLLKHSRELKEDDIDIYSPVLRDNGKEGVVDLVLSGTIPQSNKLEHLYIVIELKRPSQPINAEVLHQTESYALAVAQDERFDKTRTKWVFIAISNHLTDDAKERVSQSGRANGIYYESNDRRVVVWAKEWSEIINECSARMSFFQERLQYTATNQEGRNYITKKYQQYLPSEEEETTDFNP